MLPWFAPAGCRRWAAQDGVAMVEATIGTILLLFAALAAVQLVLVFHGTLAAHGAAIRSARTLAVTGSRQLAQSTYEDQRSAALGMIRWEQFDCSQTSTMAQCEVVIKVPVIVPGGGLFGGGGLTGPLLVRETGAYPIGSRSGG